MDTLENIQIFLQNGPKFKGKQPKIGSAGARKIMETLNNWRSSAQFHLKKF